MPIYADRYKSRKEVVVERVVVPVIEPVVEEPLPEVVPVEEKKGNDAERYFYELNGRW